MNNLTLKLGIKMTSLDITEITGKEHKNVLADIRKEIEDLGEEIGRLIFEQSSYLNSQNKSQPCYIFGRKGAMQLALKYDAVTRYKVIERIEELEKLSTDSYMIDDPVTRAKAWIREREEKFLLEQTNQKQSQIIGELKPKADYTDNILQNKGLVTITQIAKDYGMTGHKMNELLHKLKVQYKQSGQWFLYTTYHDKGYTHSETIDITRSDGRPDVKMNTKWTQKGRIFLYNLLKGVGVLPTIEQ